ncbi:MAG: phosphatidylglycerol lysyltransferase domain-containing protein, partial [Thiovulaceae bacterium]|nr:phosphatidylglycerol lysyltransferase domain-containing protein [Sulfurimonadaceae bacterium]
GWCIEVGGREGNKCLASELCAVGRALSHYFELKLTGGLIRVDGKVVAYSIGEQLNSDTFIVHIEKASAGVRGSYQIINREFAEKNAKNFKYINREDDAGDEGLRQAKNSYYPVFMQEKFIAKIF